MALRVAPSRYYAGLAEAARLGPTRVLPQGVDPTGPWEGAEGPLVFLGTLAPHKGAHLVVEAFRRAFPERARAGEGLLVHGPVVDPAYARSLRWPLAGPLAPDEVPPLLRRARALVLGSIWPENAPLVLSEARACGCPVVAPAIGGIPEVVEDGRDGWLYPAGEREALAGALRRVVHDAPLLPRPPPTLEAHAAAVISLYEEVLFAAGRRGG
jgi:glycosyltransferase involved in cell wall biosynthesis